MDRRERIDDPVSTMRAMLRGWQSNLWTALPGIVQSFDVAKMTAVVQPAIRGQFLSQEGKWTDAQLPLLLDCPVQFPGGGGFVLTFPLAEGDECLVVFSSRCIDAWWQSGGIQSQAELRLHDLSDGFCLPKVWSNGKVPSGTSTTTAQLRSDDGELYIELASGHVARIVAPGGVEITGDLRVTGGVTAGQGGIDQVTLQQHIHPANGSPPTPGH